MLAYTVSLQGGNPSYEGGLISAFRSDGSLKPEWMASRVIEGANSLGRVVILSYFYQRQDQVLANDDAVRAGVRNATDWLIDRDYRNVIIEIANEFDSTLHDRTIIKTNSALGGIAELVLLAKARFDGRGYRLPVFVSSRSSATAGYTGALKEAVDLVLIHRSVTTPEQDRLNTAALVADPMVHGPVVMNEDRQETRTAAATQAGLDLEKRTASDVLGAGGSWGLSWQSYNQGCPID